METKVWITTHSGKMNGIRSISTNPLTNGFCQCMHSTPDERMICKHCYAHTYAKMRPSLREHIQKNSEILSKAVLIPSVLPVYDDEFMRFNSFGEIINTNHLINLFSICNKNPQTTHVIYTKRMNLIEMFHCFIPTNLIVVESNPVINDAHSTPRSWAADYIFNVVTQKYAEEKHINITCTKNCNVCRKCYTMRMNPYGSRFIVEELK